MNPNEIKVPNRVAQINAEIARQGNKGYSVAPNTTDSSGNLLTPQIPTTITSSMLGSNVAPINLPTPTPPSTAGAGLSGEVTAKITNDYNNLANELKTAQEQAKEQADSTKSGLLEKLGLKSQAVEDKAAAYQTPEFLAKQKAVNDAYSEVQKLDAAQRSELEALNAQGLTGAGSQSAQAGISRKYSLARANLAVVYDVANRDLQSAVENIDRAAALKQEAVQPFVDYYSKILDGDLSAFSKAEQNTLQLRLSEYQRKQDDISKVGEILKTAVANGVQLSSQDVTKINSFDNPNDALGYLASKGISLQNPVDAQIKQAQLDKINADIALTGAQKQKVLDESSPQATSKEALQKNEALTLAKELRLDTAVGKKSAVGSSVAKLIPFGQTLGLQGNRTAFEAKVNTLKSNLTLDNLKLLKGAMSDKDLLFLNSIGSSLDVNMSETQFNSELDRIISKLESAGGGVISEEDQLRKQGYTEEQIQQIKNAP